MEKMLVMKKQQPILHDLYSEDVLLYSYVHHLSLPTMRSLGEKCQQAGRERNHDQTMIGSSSGTMLWRVKAAVHFYTYTSMYILLLYVLCGH